VRCASENVEMRKRMAAEAEKQATHERVGGWMGRDM
jgi:hypothetical protein